MRRRKSHNELILDAFARPVRAGTRLQDCVLKVRRSRTVGETEFEIALGELFVCASDAFRERNGLRRKVKELAAELARAQP